MDPPQPKFDDAVTRAERRVQECEEHVARVGARILAHERAGHTKAAAIARYSLMAMEDTLETMRGMLYSLRVSRDIQDR